jgi:hypothetical protein
MKRGGGSAGWLKEQKREPPSRLDWRPLLFARLVLPVALWAMRRIIVFRAAFFVGIVAGPLVHLIIGGFVMTMRTMFLAVRAVSLVMRAMSLATMLR